ncbi:choline dehydrogenase, putative [Talaromyces stipitatus ATCC 10500]|uniref:Choline dehydrogenase, putative n=1 Tax=Talaromyces stipitatus (strain ATCC 10500 / CBS 375.48 / QM 6759 / NRRL 1006) TaxID=441959 RepID=B8MHF8_TALSN|nr:choline dehydrogenase, putative [Talaromyces stipitatus ATCC 10500]EED17137.1 choline dehydrogenase, putative [Talaromyces stipitatus ATCC 10500]
MTMTVAMSDNSTIPEEVDVVIAGGGTTGLVVATRLAKADSNMSILVLEHGPNTRNDPLVVNPAFYLMNIAPNSPRASFYRSKASKDLAGRESIVPIGKCLGGGSSINFMVYSRPQAIDFDAWNVPGWSGEDMIPMFRKYENFQDTDPAIDSSVHGYDGEFGVSAGTNAQPTFQHDFFEACSNVGISTTADVQNFHTANAVGKWNMWIDPKTGLRQDVPHCLLFPLLDQINTGLQVATDVIVNRILFDDNKATGVEYTRNGNDVAIVKARRLVVLASGALGSPQVLERSGVGDKDLLSKLGILVISDLPGVGTNYQDHNVVFYPYKSSAGIEETIDGVVSGRLTLQEALKQKQANPSRNVIGWNGLDCVGKLRPAEVASLHPILQKAWEEDFKLQPERPLMLIATIAGYVGDHSGIDIGQYFSCGPYTPYPYSRGLIHITGRAVTDEPHFDCGFLSNALDLEKLVWGYKLQREIVRRMSHYRGPLAVGHPTFPEGSNASYEAVDRVSKEQGRFIPIDYSAEDDEAIRTFIRERVHTTWHSLGTCAMKPREKGGVVDHKLNVYGVESLKIVDLSICPLNVSANTYATALAVGEKAAYIIAEDLNIPY